jgi:hypothetical protein
MLKDKRQDLINHIKEHRDYLALCGETLDIYQGNLLPYVDAILRKSLSKQYYETITDRVIPINIIQRYIDKVSIVYNNPPKRVSMDESQQEFVDFYVKQFDFNETGMDCDTYSNLFKNYALEPYIGDNGKPKLRALPANSFLVYSDSENDPNCETVFLKFIKYASNDMDSLLVFAYSDTEFDAFYLNGKDASEYLVDNEGVNPLGVIPFVYGNRQKNTLIPQQDTDMLAIAKGIPALLVDGIGCQMYQSFSILWGIDVKIDEPRISPNAFWNMKSDRESDKAPQVGTIKPEADTEQIMKFTKDLFILWLETKGVRVGSTGSTDGQNASSGIAKIIDEMDAYNIIKKSAAMFEKEEREFWNVKMPAIHNYWLATKQIDAREYPPMVNEEMEVSISFEKPKPLISRSEQLANIESELRIGTMTKKQAVKELHPEYSKEETNEVLSVGNKNKDKTPEENEQRTEGENSGGSN